MARPNLFLIDSIRKAARNIEKGNPYEWGHMGSCNCGNLAQVVCKLDKSVIHQYAMQGAGDWSEQTLSYCSTSGLPFDLMVSELLAAGLDLQDLKHLEKLSDPTVLSKLPLDRKYVSHNSREDVVLYMYTWANVLEEQLLAPIKINFEMEEMVEIGQ
jgi:hypothetical protein